eukprot:TCALIF_11115-PA protein Name:"Protein of unknown function" AED:0.13 eAED:0.13 QI:0/0.6/0.5/1/0.6/0.5/6/0/389
MNDSLTTIDHDREQHRCETGSEQDNRQWRCKHHRNHNRGWKMYLRDMHLWEQQFSTSSMAAAVTSTQSSQSAQRAMEGKERRSSAGGQALVEPRKISDTALANLGSEVDVGQAQTSYMTSESKRESSAMSHSRESRSEMKTYEARKSSGSYEKHSGSLNRSSSTLVRQNTFTKDDADSFTNNVSYGKTQATKIVGSKLVHTEKLDQLSSINYSEQRATPAKPRDNLKVGAETQWVPATKLNPYSYEPEQKSLSSTKPVRRKTWTKQDAEKHIQQVGASVLDQKSRVNNSAETITQVKRSASEQRLWGAQKSDVNIGGEFDKETPKEWQPGQRAQVVRHDDNLKMEGGMETSRQEWATKGERAEIIRHSDNLKSEGTFEGRQIEGWAPGT